MQVFDVGVARIGGKQGGMILERGEQHRAAIVDHRVGIAAIGLRIEAEQVERQVELEAAVGAKAQVIADRDRLLLHCLVVDVVGRIAKQP